MTLPSCSTDTLAQGGHAEGFKASVHLGLFALAAMCFGYNAMAWGQRREAHLLTNVGVYAALMAFESGRIKDHMRQS